jgi:hypothetical protein
MLSRRDCSLSLGTRTMNPYRIYRDEWARALASQARAAEYSTFVAMPFREHFSYRSGEILTGVIRAAADEANRRAETPKRFAPPESADIPGGATVVTEEIVLRIIESHLFLADVTFENAGVLLETGVAFGTKPAAQIILITQGSYLDLHFDLRNNRVLSYSPGGELATLASAMIAAANYFESQLSQIVTSVAKRLSPEAIMALHWYGSIQHEHGAAASLHAGYRGVNFDGPDGRVRFETALRELRDRDLVWTEYKVKAASGGDAYGTHATELGWLVIENLWTELRRGGGA